MGDSLGGSVEPPNTVGKSGEGTGGHGRGQAGSRYTEHITGLSQ
jgi:hypothetical protein